MIFYFGNWINRLSAQVADGAADQPEGDDTTAGHNDVGKRIFGRNASGQSGQLIQPCPSILPVQPGGTR